MDGFGAIKWLARVGFAVQQVYAAITCRLERNLGVEEMRREAGEWAVGLSRFGVAARAVVFALLGWAIVVAGWFRDASEVGTTASSFRTLAAQPGGLGRWLLGVTAAGFVAYGFYEIIHARYLDNANVDHRADHWRQRRSTRGHGQATLSRHGSYSGIRRPSWYISTTIHAIVSACWRINATP
jgi:hypothetical protein